MTRSPRCRRDAGGHVADRAGADHEEGAALLDVGVLDGLPRGGQDVGEEEEPVVRRTVRDLDRQRVAEGHAQHLGLATGHLAVELAVAEQAGARAGVAVLRRLALAEQLRSHIQHDPQLMLKGTTTRSPTCSVSTAGPTSRTMPIGSWPTMSPAVMNGDSGS